MEMTLEKKPSEIDIESDEFKKDVEEATKEYEKTTTKEEEFLEEIHIMTNTTEDEFAEGVYELGRISLNPDQWRERETKIAECNILKAKIELLNEVSSLFVNICSSRT